MLVRKHIHSLLSSYYNQPYHAVVGSISDGPLIQSPIINFANLLGEWHWKYKYHKLYTQQSGQWLTPVELFKPFYSQIVGNFIAKEITARSTSATCSSNSINDNAMKTKQRRNSTGKSDCQIEGLQIVEIGGGRGTNALCILDHLESKFPHVYANLDSYTIMDASPTLLHHLNQLLVDGTTGNNKLLEGSMGNSNTCTNRHHEKVILKQIDMLDVAEKRTNFLEKSNQPTIVIALEVLDNLSHDKITLSKSTGEVLQAEIVSKDNQSNHDDQTCQKEEIFTTLSDELIKRVLSLQQSYIPSLASRHNTSWVPTVTCGMLDEIFNARPNTSLLFADFDWLPKPQLESSSLRTRRSLEGINEPIITCMNDIDHLCFLEAPPFCDILFPTDFPILQCYTEQLLLNRAISSTVNVMKQHEFLLQYGHDEVDDTKGRLTGFTPLLSDFTNCSVMTVSAT